MNFPGDEIYVPTSRNALHSPHMYDTSDAMLHAVHAGQIQLILGPMWAGKSSELLRRVRRYSCAKRNCLLIKFGKDRRYSDDDCVATHDKIFHDACACEKLACIDETVKNCDVVGIDEGQFFPDIVEYSEKWANEGKTVIIAALSGTFQRKSFGRVLELVPLAEGITHLSAVCMPCADRNIMRLAHFSKRISCEDAVEVIGGSDKYIAVCRDCFFEDSATSNVEFVVPVSVSDADTTSPMSPNSPCSSQNDSSDSIFNEVSALDSFEDDQEGSFVSVLSKDSSVCFSNPASPSKLDVSLHAVDPSLSSPLIPL